MYERLCAPNEIEIDGREVGGERERDQRERADQQREHGQPRARAVPSTDARDASHTDESQDDHGRDQCQQ
jgi:hypothetical protein